MERTDLGTTVFNFYEQITPPPSFKTFIEGWRHFGKYTESLDHYVGAKLYRNLDPKGRFPYVNIATFNGPKERIIRDMTAPAPELVKALIEGHGLPGHQLNHPGAYSEVCTDNNNHHSTDSSSQLGTVILVSAFKATNSESETNTSEFEDRWADQTGMNTIKDFVKNKNGKLGKHGFFVRYTPFEPFHSALHVFYCEFPGFTGEEEDLVLMADQLKETKLIFGFELYDSSLYCLDQISLSNKLK